MPVAPILHNNHSHAPRWVHKGGYAIGLDQYYTRSEVAKQCYQSFCKVAEQKGVDLGAYTFLEPSAGTGTFLRWLPDPKIGLDLYPKHPGVQQADFFQWKPNTSIQYVAIGNPPFGHRAWLALAFLKRLANFCELVGFILPMYFQSDGKGTPKNRVPNMTLLHSQELPYDIFESPEGKSISINTVWQIWGKKDLNHQINKATCDEYLNIYTVCTVPKRRCGLQRMNQYDCFIQSTFYKPPKIVTSFEEVQYGSGYGMIIKKEKEAVIQALKNADWQRYSLRATNHCRHIGMQHIRQCLCEAGFADKRPIAVRLKTITKLV